jgi:lipoate-protein ligase A
MPTLLCPICESSVRARRTGDTTGYHCPTHGDFKVADTVFAEAKAKAKAKDYTREQWEAALERAEERTEDDEWPLIVTDDFF